MSLLASPALPPKEQTQPASPLGLFLPARPQRGKSPARTGVDGEEPLADLTAGPTALLNSSWGRRALVSAQLGGAHGKSRCVVVVLYCLA